MSNKFITIKDSIRTIDASGWKKGYNIAKIMSRTLTPLDFLSMSLKYRNSTMGIIRMDNCWG